jgi:hypothetical protein
MITAKIFIKPHLREYCIARYADFDSETPVHFPAYTDLYVLIWDRLRKRPPDHPVDAGNMILALPKRSEGKNPRDYNFITVAAQREIERKIETMMWAEFREYIENEHFRQGVLYSQAIRAFIDRYQIYSISEDAFRKNYYRWKLKVRNRGRNTGVLKKITSISRPVLSQKRGRKK